MKRNMPGYSRVFHEDTDWNPITRRVESKIPQWDFGKKGHIGNIGLKPVTDTARWLAPKKEEPKED